MRLELFIVSLFVVLVSCNSNPEYQAYSLPETAISWASEGFMKFELDTVTSLNGINSFGYNENDSSFYFYNFQNNQILFFDNNGVFIRRIEIPKQGPNSVYAGYNTGFLIADKYYVNEPNRFSVSVYEESSDTLVLKDKFRYSMDVIHDKFKSGTGPFSLFNTPMFLFNEKLYFVANGFGALSDLKQAFNAPDDFPINSALVYDLNEKHMSAHLPRPVSLNEGYRGKGFKFKVSHAFNPKKNKIVYGFGAYGSLLELDVDNQIREYPIRSNIVEGFKPFSKSQSPMARERWIKYEYMTPEVSNIAFNAYDNYYHLFIKMGQSEAEHDDPRTHGKRDYLMITLSEDFEIVGEQQFDSHYDPNFIHFSTDGLHILRRDLYDLDDNYLTFEILKPHEN